MYIIEGKCENKDCKAKGQMVIFNAGFSDFDLELSEAKCPMCDKKIKPIKPGIIHIMLK